MAAQNKMDMSLDEIISLSRRQSRGTGGPRGRGRGSRGRGRGSRGRGRAWSSRGGASAGTRGKSFGRGQRGGYRGGRGRSARGESGPRRPGGLRGGRRFYNRNQGQVSAVQRVHSQQYLALQQSQQAARSNVVNRRRGIVQNQQGSTRGRGRKRLVRPTSRGGQKNVIVVQGRGRGRRGGSTIALLTMRSITGSTRGRRGIGRGRGNIQRVAQASVSRARLRLMLNRQKQQQSSEEVRTIQRGRGSRRGRGRGRGFSSAGISRMQVAIMQPMEEEPEGVELSPGFAADQHTSRSLNSRFTPQSPTSMQSERIILSNGRAVSYHQ